MMYCLRRDVPCSSSPVDGRYIGSIDRLLHGLGCLGSGHNRFRVGDIRPVSRLGNQRVIARFLHAVLLLK